MDRVLSRPLTIFGFPWRRVLLLNYLAVNLVLILVEDFRLSRVDHELWASIPQRLATGTLYDKLGIHADYVWSPVIAPLMGLVGIVGPVAWSFAYLVVLLLKDWRLIALVAVSWGFWSDVAHGGPMTFALVLGFWALRGNRWAALGYFGLALLIPRPLFLPLAVWLLWKRPDLRLPFAVMFAVHALLVVASGYGGAWMDAALIHGAEPPYDIGPTGIFGFAWYVVGLPLAAWLTWRGKVGWAGLAVSPYLLPSYLLMPFVEWRRETR